MKYIILTFLLFFMFSCTEKEGTIKIMPPSILPQAAGDMPTEAENTIDYVLEVMNVTDSLHLHASKKIVGTGDTLHVWFNYKEPDLNLDSLALPYNESHSIIIINEDDLWDLDGDANYNYKDWIYLDAGEWQMFITARNEVGNKRSNRYDFTVVGTAPVKVIIHGI